MNTNPIKVLIVDDSAVIRGLLTRALSEDTDIEVAGSVMHGEAALSWLKKNEAEIVVLDVEMPVMDGLETLRQLQKLHPQIRVIMASSLTQSGAKTTMMALSLGAAACIAKPNANSATQAIQSVSRELIPLVKGLAKKPNNTARQSQQTIRAQSLTFKPVTIENRPACLRRSEPILSPKLLVIGASTGGPNALNKVLCDLGPDFQTPTLIVQHMPKMFTAIMANHLANDTKRRVKEAEHGEFVLPGTTYVAPGDFHLEVHVVADGMRLSLNQHAEEHYCRPSVNPLFRTAAKVAGSRILSVMLTGMGSDGLEGTEAIVEAGGYVIAQDEASSVVWGMPGAIANAGLTHEILPLDRIGNRILQLCSKTTETVKA